MYYAANILKCWDPCTIVSYTGDVAIARCIDCTMKKPPLAYYIAVRLEGRNILHVLVRQHVCLDIEA